MKRKEATDAARLREEAARRRAEAEALELAADVLEQLPHAADNATVDTTMDDANAVAAAPDAPKTRGAGVSRARLTSDSRRHLFVQALVKAGTTVTEAAKQLGYGRTTVQSWYASGENGRPIHRQVALQIEKRWGVPLSAWRRIVD